MCRYIAIEGGKYSVSANIINPDKIFRGSNSWEGSIGGHDKGQGTNRRAIQTQNLLRREVLPEHVANMLLAIVNEDIFGAITDTMIPVGGRIL